MIDLIEYGGGNLGSIRRSLDRLGISYRMVSQGKELTGRPIILPGVGAFGALMKNLKKRELLEALQSTLIMGTPYLGICVGHQILFQKSEESPEEPGLDLIPGKVVRFKSKKVPQIGWNKLLDPKSEKEEGFVYFVNSYYAQPDNQKDSLYESDYNGRFCAGIRKENLTGFQFHPEKSGLLGHLLIRRWYDAL